LTHFKFCKSIFLSELSDRLGLGSAAATNTKQTSMLRHSNLFNDTQRLRLKKRRTSLSSMFSHEAPTLGELRRTCFLAAAPVPPRPREPPPPPPPVADVLKPVVPPKKSSLLFNVPFTQAEVNRINNVINGTLKRGGSDDDDIEDDDDVDCFSTDEFSSSEDGGDMDNPPLTPAPILTLAYESLNSNDMGRNSPSLY
jgi:hypothetical protein